MGKSVIPADFSVSEVMKSWVESAVPNLNFVREHERFCDYWRANGRMMHDWEATWRNWMRRAPSMGGCMYTQDELRIFKLMTQFEPQGFRRAYHHENSVMYQVAFDAWDMARKQNPKRDVSGLVSDIAKARRA